MSDSAARPTFLFHDYETFGTHPALDRPAQFAAIRTDDEFNVIGEPEVFYCKPADDYLPQPGAVMVTGITPQEARDKGVSEAEFARRIHDLFTVPNTCVVGYNNIRFDDEVTRNIFYRNFYDPYAWSWQNRNSRWDLLDIMRACYALRPEDADRLGINRQHCLDNLKVLRDNPQVREKVVAIFAEAEPFVPSDNVDAQLYNGFFSDADRAAMNIVLQTDPRNLPALDITFADKRIEKLMFNYRARNYPGSLDEAEQERWLQHRRNVFTPEFLNSYAQELEMLYGQYEGDAEKQALLKALFQYAQEIV